FRGVNDGPRVGVEEGFIGDRCRGRDVLPHRCCVLPGNSYQRPSHFLCPPFSSIADCGFRISDSRELQQTSIRNPKSAIKKPVRPLSDGLLWKGKTRKPESQIWGQSRVQLEVVCRGMRAKDRQMTSPIWSAATCRRFRSDARAIAATSRHTPKELVRLQLTKAAPEATPTSDCTRQSPKSSKPRGRSCVASNQIRHFR